MSQQRVAIVGGYGAFGAHAAERLALVPGLEVVIAGRSLEKAQTFAKALRATARAEISCARLDATQAGSADIRALGAGIMINASGPFQAQRYDLARACIAAGCHYIDLADARGFVTGITDLDKPAREANVCVISGASSVPGLSSAVVREFADAFLDIDEIEIGISPGNSFDPGIATVASILGGVGKPFSRTSRGNTQTAYGWQGLRRHNFPGLGRRWMSGVDVPDLDLLPRHVPGLRSANFIAGLEVAPFHLGLWALSWLVRAGLVRDLKGLSSMLLNLKRRLRFLGGDEGAMFVSMRGASANHAPKTIVWTLIARRGDGPYVPAIPSVILAKKLASGSGPAPGARACFGLFNLGEFLAETSGLAITCQALDR